MTDHCAFPKCGKELTHVPGRKKKKYCNQNCNTRHWQMLHPAYKPKTKRLPLEEYEKLAGKGVLEGYTFDIKKNEIFKVANNVLETGMAISEITEAGVRAIHPFSDEGWKVQEQAKIQKRISQIDEMLKMPPKYLPKEKRTKLQTELAELKNKQL